MSISAASRRAMHGSLSKRKRNAASGTLHPRRAARARLWRACVAAREAVRPFEAALHQHLSDEHAQLVEQLVDLTARDAATPMLNVLAGLSNDDPRQIAIGYGQQLAQAVPGGAMSGMTRGVGTSGIAGVGLHNLATPGRALVESIPVSEPQITQGITKSRRQSVQASAARD